MAGGGRVPTTYRALVVGGGVVGLAALERLSASSCGPVALIEAARLGHARGSSHGAARIARSTYPDAFYVRLMHAALAQDWARLQRDAGEALVHPTPMCLFGPPDGPFEAYASAVGPEVERLDPAAAARAFPELRFDGAAGALRDRSAGIVAAAATCRALARLALRRGATLYEQTRCTAIELASDPIRVATTRGELRAERLVIAAGAWSARLVPALSERLTPLRQTVGYFGHDGAGAMGRFAPWAWLGPGANGIHYGLPAFGGEGLKVARHRTAGLAEDPDEDPDEEVEAERAELAHLARLLARLLRQAPGPLLRAETCMYTMTPSEDFVLGQHPADARVAVCAGLSGHGFKFAPLFGRALAGLVERGRSGVPELEAEGARFALA